MEFSDEVSAGLTYLGSGNHFSDENFKKLVNSCLGLLSGEPNIERVSSICPEKGDIAKQSYASLLTFTIECIRNDVIGDIKSLLTKFNFKTTRIEQYIKNFSFYKENIVKNLENCQSGWPNLVDTSWKLDFIIKSSIQNHIGEPLYYVVLTTEKDGNLDYVRFTCDLHQLQDLSTKLKEIVCLMVRGERKMSLSLWNLWDVKPPPMCKTKVRLKHKEINNLKKLLFEIVNSLRNMKELEFEAALLSRLMYKSKRLFRHDKGLQNMVKINQCLKRYLKLNMVKVVNEFNKNLPGKLPEDATHAYLPTRQTFEWVLFRFQAFGQLLARSGRLAQKAGPQLYSKLCLGWALKPTLCFYACNSRLLVLSKFLVVKSIEWYDSLRRFLPLFESTAPFLGGKHELPDDLKKFLGEVDFFTPPKRSGIDKIFEMIDLSVDDDEGDVTNVHRQLFKPFLKGKTIEIDSDVEEIDVEEKEEEEIPRNRKLEDVDLGVPVGKKPEKVLHATTKKKRKIGMESKFA